MNWIGFIMYNIGWAVGVVSRFVVSGWVDGFNHYVEEVNAEIIKGAQEIIDNERREES